MGSVRPLGRACSSFDRDPDGTCPVFLGRKHCALEVCCCVCYRYFSYPRSAVLGSAVCLTASQPQYCWSRNISGREFGNLSTCSGGKEDLELLLGVDLARMSGSGGDPWTMGSRWPHR